MFSNPPRYTDWFVVDGELADKSKVDIARDGAEVSKEKPELVSALFPSQRWRKYLNNLRNKRHRSTGASTRRTCVAGGTTTIARATSGSSSRVDSDAPGLAKRAGDEQEPPREISLLKHRCPR